MPFCPNCDRRLHEGKCSRCDAELPDAPATTKAPQPQTEAESEQSGAPLMFASLLTSNPAVELEPEAASLAVATETARPEPLSAASAASIAVATKASRDNAGSSDGPAVQRDQLGYLPRLNTGELDSLMKAEAAAIAKAADVKQAVVTVPAVHPGSASA